MTFQGVNDLNLGCQCRQSFGTFPGGTDAHWQSRFLATHGVRAVAYLSPFGGEVSRRFQRAHLQLPGPVSVDGFRTTDLPRKPARHRGVSARAAHQTLSHGAAWQSEPQHPGRRQRVARLAHLCRVRPLAYPHRTPTVCSGASCSGSRRDGLRLGCHHHRPVPVAVSLGEVSQNQRRRSSCIRCSTCAATFPSFIHISDGKLHDVNVLDVLIAEPGAFYVMDRGYLDFERLYASIRPPAFFVTRAKRNFKFKRVVFSPGRSHRRDCTATKTVELLEFYSSPGLPGSGCVAFAITMPKVGDAGVLDQHLTLAP